MPSKLLLSRGLCDPPRDDRAARARRAARTGRAVRADSDGDSDGDSNGDPDGDSDGDSETSNNNKKRRETRAGGVTCCDCVMCITRACVFTLTWC